VQNKANHSYSLLLTLRISFIYWKQLHKSFLEHKACHAPLCSSIIELAQNNG